MRENLRVVGAETRYALSGDVHIAYQVVGHGPFDLVFVPGFVTHMELQWRLPGIGPFLRDLASFSRLIRFDKRGTGMSDPVSGAPSLETRMDDLRAVMDAVGSRRAAFCGLPPRRSNLATGAGATCWNGITRWCAGSCCGIAAVRLTPLAMTSSPPSMGPRVPSAAPARSLTAYVISACPCPRVCIR